MTKKKLKAKKPEAKEDQIPGLTYPNDTEVIGAVSKLAKMKKSAQSSAGLMGEEVNKLCDKKHFDKKALGLIRSLESMTDERFAITWPHIKKYANALDFDKRATQQHEMFEKAEVEKKAEAEKTEADNVRQLRPARAVEEGAAASG